MSITAFMKSRSMGLLGDTSTDAVIVSFFDLQANG
jgi:hypothetical protein